ncbi:protein-export chaperone SecB [Salinimicrobium sp. MT39]|uniref:Protein-export chaperone SecB n=1 Tax=Salinimicrobium profundisediminis TaxID=2994553 RepID=A0A9X3I2B2_9FLAO|nr:protein-export chaperone SecB [Salinimicrobium profundisediminis]MCX2839841.1 protein-export chaperone SecB [Salinimicrobium profundisediminis]
MEKASFSIEKYIFDKVIINLENHTSNKLSVDFKPSGVFHKETSTYDLSFDFSAYTENEKEIEPFVNVRCIGTFKFTSLSSFEDIPPYFYRNSIAILFPYLRAYVSMVTNQANIPPVVLPTMNLVSLEKPLKDNTTVV